MKQIEKIILIVIALLIFSRLGHIAKDVIYVYSVGAGEPSPEQSALFKNASIILASFVNIGSAIWLYIESRKTNFNAWVWSLFGIFFGLIAVVIYYLISLKSQIEDIRNQIKKETTK